MIEYFIHPHHGQLHIYLILGAKRVIWRLTHAYVLIIRESIVSRRSMKATQALPLLLLAAAAARGQNTSSELAWRSELVVSSPTFQLLPHYLPPLLLRGTLHASRDQHASYQPRYLVISQQGWIVYSGGVLTSVRIAKIGRLGTTRGVLFRKR